VPYSRQRLDEIAIRLNEIANERAALVARDRGLAQEIARESDWLGTQTRFESRAQEQAVVWRQPVAAGTDVVKGDVLAELVDCADMFVLARIPLDDAATISPGDAVSIEIAGTRVATTAKYGSCAARHRRRPAAPRLPGWTPPAPTAGRRWK